MLELSLAIQLEKLLTDTMLKAHLNQKEVDILFKKNKQLFQDLCRCIKTANLYFGSIDY